MIPATRVTESYFILSETSYIVLGEGSLEHLQVTDWKLGSQTVTDLNHGAMTEDWFHNNYRH